MKYVPGKILHAVPYVPALLFDVGAYTAKIQDSLKVCCSAIRYLIQEPKEAYYLLNYAFLRTLFY